MTSMLDGPRRAAASGMTKRLVVLLHGYGADGDDLFGLAEPLSQALPDAAFAAPNAPDRCVGNPMGYQWFPIPGLDGSSWDRAEAAMRESLDLLHAFLDAELARHGLTGADLALVGFSQGAMMSLDAGPRRPDGVAGIVGFSGKLLRPEALADDAIAKPPVLLVHGDQDETLPPSCMDEARDALSAAGFPVRWKLCQGLGHGVAPEGLQLAAGFLISLFSARAGS